MPKLVLALPLRLMTITEALRSGDADQAYGRLTIAIADLLLGIKNIHVAHLLATQELLQRYKRSTLGPFWMTIGLVIWLVTVSFVFSKVFQLNLITYLPHVACGLVIWNFISQTLSDSSVCFMNNQEYLRSAPLPLSLFVYRTVLYNLYVAAHNVAAIGVIIIALRGEASLGAILALPGIALVALNVGWMGTILSIVCARFRDLPQVVANFLQVAFYLTPIVWLPSLLRPSDQWLLAPNIFHYLIEVIRAPILGGELHLSYWIVSVLAAVLGWAAAVICLAKYRARISYWIL
jgi:lipopolysaccharide transport system permease protein